MAEEELELDVNQSKGSKTTTILIIVLIIIILVMGGVGAWFYLANGDEESSSNNLANKTEKGLAPLLYLTMVPEFVVNFGHNSKVRFLQIDLQIATRDQNALDAINTYRPVLRNDILVLLSGQSFEGLKERDGKEALQQKILNTINRVINDAMHGGKDKHNSKNKKNNNEHVEGPIESVYFTSFIMQ